MNRRRWHQWAIFLGGVAAGGAGLILVSLWTPGEVDSYVPLVPTVRIPLWARPGTVSADPIRVAMPTAQSVREAFAAKRHVTVAPGTRELILPHHLVAARDIASLLSSTQKPSVVYLLAPDHFSQGRTALTTTDASFTSDNGSTLSRSDLIEGLITDVSELRADRKPFETEHGVFNLVPYFTEAWGTVTVVPIIVRIDASKDAQAQLARVLTERLRMDKRALLVTSVDFSHYLPAFAADFHDILAENVITALADLETGRVELDSPGALGVGLKTARALGLGRVSIHSHTNSLRILQATIAQDSTSHFTASFAPGPIASQDVATVLLTGDVMLDRTVRDRMTAAKDPFYPFQHIRGQEDRFFHGQDLVVANLEGPVTPTRRPPNKELDFAFDPSVIATLTSIGIDAVSQANNHALDQGRDGADESRRLLTEGGLTVFGDQVRDDTASSLAVLERRGQSIAFVGFNITDNPLNRDEAAASLAGARARAKHVIAFMHWGEEYKAKPNATQTELAHWLIDHGADAVIGMHPHWMQSVEVYKGRPIAYSLGNFIFDQDWSTETRQGLVTGLAFFPDRTELHLFPVQIDQSQPRLLTGNERTKRLKYLADISDPALATMITNGMLTTNPTP